ncbi:MAG TPA: hypothetical protein VKH44_08330 [Pirellulaceae bacterium]|nr:hypothetical protein [Pirellulaceae bacterium]
MHRNSMSDPAAGLLVPSNNQPRSATMDNEHLHDLIEPARLVHGQWKHVSSIHVQRIKRADRQETKILQ